MNPVNSVLYELDCDAASAILRGAMTVDSAALRDNPVLAKFRAALDNMYGARLERVVLFGSQARGDAPRATR